MMKVVVIIALFALCHADRQNARDAVALEVNSDTTVGCEGAYTIPNYLASSGYRDPDAWKYGVPPGAKVTVKRVFSSSLQYLNGKTGIVVTTDSFDGHGLVPTHMGLGGAVCEFQGKIFFPDLPIGNLGQKNRNLGKYKGKPVFGMDMGGKVILSDVSLPSGKLEEVVTEGFKVTGPIIDETFKEVIMQQVLEVVPLKPLETLPMEKMEDIKPVEMLKAPKPLKPLETLPMEKIEDIKPVDMLKASQPLKPLLTIKPEVVLEAAELISDSDLLQKVKPVIDSLMEPIALSDAVVQRQTLTDYTPETQLMQAAEMVPDTLIDTIQLEPLHIVPPGELQPAQELLLDALVREVAKPAPTVDLSTHEGIRAHCATKRQKLKCCWQNCEHNFVDEQGVCLKICKADSGI